MNDMHEIHDMREIHNIYNSSEPYEYIIDNAGNYKIAHGDFYTTWKQIVADIVYDELQVELDDLPDEDYRMCYDEHMSPMNMAQIIITNNNIYY